MNGEQRIVSGLNSVHHSQLTSKKKVCKKWQILIKVQLYINQHKLQMM